MLKAMSKFQGVLKMFMLGMLKTILKTVLKYKKNTITLYSTCWNWVADFVFLLQFCTSNWSETYMSHFAYACKMRCPLNLVFENSEYLWFYWSFCIVILDYGLKLHKLSNHTLVILQKWLKIQCKLFAL